MANNCMNQLVVEVSTSVFEEFGIKDGDEFNMEDFVPCPDHSCPMEFYGSTVYQCDPTVTVTESDYRTTMKVSFDTRWSPVEAFAEMLYVKLLTKDSAASVELSYWEPGCEFSGYWYDGSENDDDYPNMKYVDSISKYVTAQGYLEIPTGMRMFLAEEDVCDAHQAVVAMTEIMNECAKRGDYSKIQYDAEELTEVIESYLE